MRLSRRTVLSMLSVVAISGGVSTVIGGHLLSQSRTRETEDRVPQDLNAAPEGSQEREDIQAIIDATTRCRDIVRGLLNFSR